MSDWELKKQNFFFSVHDIFINEGEKVKESGAKWKIVLLRRRSSRRR